MSTVETQVFVLPRQQLLNMLREEHEITVRVLRAFPDSQLDLRPHAKSKTARELAQVFAMAPDFIVQALTTGIDWSGPPPEMSQSRSMTEIVAACEDGHRRVMELLQSMPEEKLRQTIPFPVAPGRMQDVTLSDFILAMMCDQIHHRGQMSVYLRLADARVPSIYGPTADEPWE